MPLDARRSATVAVVAVAAPVAACAAAVRVLSHGRILGADEALSLPAGALPTTGLVLGAQAYADGRPSRFLRARLDLGRRLYEAGMVDRLIVSGAGGADSNAEHEVMRTWLLEAGVPDDAITTDPAGFDTYDSCVRARDVYGAAGLTIVSQTFHLRRAVTICQLLGVDAVGVGDETVKRRGTWGRYTVREWLANLKMVRDVATRREPVGE